jgi:hypothetical protein
MKSEVYRVRLLVVGVALLGIAVALVTNAATAIFVTTFGAGSLPDLFVASAVIVGLVGVGFASMRSRPRRRHRALLVARRARLQLDAPAARA